MSVELSRPAGMLEQTDYAPLAVGTGTRLILLAGQTATAPDGSLDATDLAGQVYAALRYIMIGVRAGGGQVGDIARLTCYVVDWQQEKWHQILDGVSRSQRSDGLADPMPPITVIGVQALFRPELLVEIEATAVVG